MCTGRRQAGVWGGGEKREEEEDGGKGKLRNPIAGIYYYEKKCSAFLKQRP